MPHMPRMPRVHRSITAIRVVVRESSLLRIPYLIQRQSSKVLVLWGTKCQGTAMADVGKFQ